MSKRIANTRNKTARSGRTRFGWRTVRFQRTNTGPKLTVEPVIKSSRIAKLKKKKFFWEGFKSLFRRTQPR